MQKFGLGTVQFGLEYGICKELGQPPLNEITDILKLADEVGFGVLDTAPTYGDSEERLGACHVSKYDFKIITKTPVFYGDVLTKEDGIGVYESIKKSIDLMKVSRVHGVLVHHANTFYLPGHEYLTDAFARLKDEGMMGKVGVSIYDGAELDRVLEVFAPDIVQLPLSLLDQRLLQSGHVAALKKQGVEIHVRSLFLQGLLLMEPKTLPDYFAPLKAKLIRFRHEISEQGLSPMEACLLFGYQLKDVDSLLLGVKTAEQLQEIINAAGYIKDKAFDFGSYGEHNPLLLNPANWPQT